MLLWIVRLFLYENLCIGLFLENLRKFFNTIISDEKITAYDSNQILKSQWEIRMISKEICLKKLSFAFCASRATVSFVAISSILFLHFSNANVLTTITSTIFIYLLINLYIRQIALKNKILKSSDKRLAEISQEILKLKSVDNLQGGCENQLSQIKIKFIHMKTFFKKIEFENVKYNTLELSLITVYFTVIFYLQVNLNYPHTLSQNPETIVTFLTYNVFFSFLAIRLFKNKDTEYLSTSSNKLQSREKDKPIGISSESEITLINTLEFRKLTLQSAEGIRQTLDFTMNSDDNIIFVSDDKNISLLRQFFDSRSKKISGEILINNLNVEKIDRKILKSILITVSTDIAIIEDTIKNNITLLNENISDQDIIKASKISKFHDYAKLLSTGYQTQIENQEFLCDVSRFCLSLTRALLSNAKIIIVDFVGLDENTDEIRELKDMLVSNILGRILIVISNDIYQIENFRKVAIMEKNIMKIGLHRELLEKNEFYSNFYVKHQRTFTFNE